MRKPIWKYKYILILTAISFTGIGAYKMPKDKKDIVQKYMQVGGTINKNSQLILYKDSTFLNYGILNDSVGSKKYVWYSYGKYKVKPPQIILNSHEISHEHDNVISTIKQGIKKNSWFGYLKPEMELLNEIYFTHPIIILKDKVVDWKKDIEYASAPNQQQKNL